MAEISSEEPSSPWHLWTVGAIAALLSGMGVLDYVATVARVEPYLAQFQQEALDYWFSLPWWVWGVWAITSFGGLAAAVLLLMRNKLAFPGFVVVLVAVLISLVVGYAIPGPESADAGGMELVFVAVAAGFAGYAFWAQSAKLLR